MMTDNREVDGNSSELADLKLMIGKMDQNINIKLGCMDHKIGKMDEKIDGIRTSVDQCWNRLDNAEASLSKVEKHLDAVDKRCEILEQKAEFYEQQKLGEAGVGSGMDDPDFWKKFDRSTPIKGWWDTIRKASFSR